MKSVKSSVSKALPIGAELVCADNSGAKLIKIITVKGYKTRTKMLMAAGVSDMITGTVKVGDPEMRHKVVQAVVVRQRKEFLRPEGMRVKFEDNACIVLKDIRLGMPKGTLVKGPIAKEVAMRWPNVAKIATIVL
ncbi:MAG TPA: 50S ribosomal protein L14 [Candidatus Nanoarchaeia archaeon]|nr:50S ribosomal protein L14 [Candidatus Nanoarchaeia archaeon]